jgi:sigma-B regulation protein RsbU (phosphoserine phosphatase)
MEYGVVIPVRDVGPMLAGCIGGPIAGLIAGLYRLLSGLPYLLVGSSIPCSISTLVIGVVCGFLEKPFKKAKKFRSLWSLIIGCCMEIFHLLLVFFFYLGVSGLDAAVAIIKEVSLPMILANAFGAFIITFCIDVVHSFQKTEEHERQISSELNIANSIQNDMLPAIFPDFPGRKEFSLAAKMTPAKEVGGDFYDFFFVDSDHFAILIGDVSGKGVPAALFMVISKTILKNDAQAGLSPCQVLTKANKELCEGNKESMFMTVWLSVYEISTGKLTYANGGHNPPLIKQGNGGYYHLKNVSGFILAGTPNMKYREYSTYLKAGDKILLYTDGVTEAMNSEQKSFGEDRLLDLVSKEKSDVTPDGLVNDIEKSLIEFRGKADQSDDITMLLLNVNLQSNALTLETKTENLEKFSDFMESILKNNDVPNSVINSMYVVLDELFSNVVNYSKSPDMTMKVAVSNNEINLDLEYQGELFDVTKTDAPDITLKAEERKIGGLGLLIVKKSVDTFTYQVKNNDTNLIMLTKKY